MCGEDEPVMLISEENLKTRNAILGFEKRINDMHLGFEKYHAGVENVMPNWEDIERELLRFSRRKILDLELSQHLDRLMYKLQNRKKIWLKWVEEAHHRPER